MNPGHFEGFEKNLGGGGGGGRGGSELYLLCWFLDLIASEASSLPTPVYSPGNLNFFSVQTGKWILSPLLGSAGVGERKG